MNAREKEAKPKRSKVRARVEHVFAQQSNHLVRTIGQARAEGKIGLMSMVYNMRRLAWLAARRDGHREPIGGSCRWHFGDIERDPISSVDLFQEFR